MKIVLTFDGMGTEAEDVLVEWIKEKIADKSIENVTPLRYVQTMDVVREKGGGELMFDEIVNIETKDFRIWFGKDRRSSNGDYQYLADGLLKVEGGVRHLVNRYRSCDLTQAMKDLSEAYFSPRPYVLGQTCDGSIDDCVHALFFSFCLKKGVDPAATHRMAYPEEEPPNYGEVQKSAEWEGVKYPKRWDKKAFAGLIESLTEINNHSLVGVLLEHDF